MKIKLYILLLISILHFNSCDILRSSLFEVLSWTPGEGYHSVPENITVTLNFSHEPHRAGAERNFSLTGNGNRIKGNFLWEEKSLTFLPLLPLEKNTDYTISLSADTRDTEGLSMDESFYRDFTTRQDNSHPEIISYYPAAYEKINNTRTQVKLEFSLPIQLNTLYENISFNPSMTGLWILDNGSKLLSSGKLAIFTPSEPWKQNTRYEIFLSSSLKDVNGMNIRNDFISIFTIGIDHVLPYLLSANRITKNNNNIQLTPDKGFSSAAEFPVENDDWEKEDKLLLVFSKPVDILSVKNFLSAENGPNIVLETFPGYETEILFRFENLPLYKNRFTLRLKAGIRDSAGNETKDEYIFKIFFNGKYSMPPELAGIRIPMSPQNEADYNPVYFSADTIYQTIEIKEENYPSDETVGTWIELYFITAEEASINIFSVMEHFRVETSNNVITFSPRRIKTDNFIIQEPQPGLEMLQRIEITGNLVNTTNYGIINFLISSGLQDSLGNRNEKAFNIPLMK